MVKNFNPFQFNSLSSGLSFLTGKSPGCLRGNLTRLICQNGTPASGFGVVLLTFLTTLITGSALVGSAFAQTQGAVETQPELVVGEIQIIRQDVFSETQVAQAQAFLRVVRQTMNGLHTSTKEHILRRELLFAPGDRFDPRVLAETERNLRGLGILNQVSVTAADTSSDGRVRIVVHVQEAWTLQTNLSYSRASNGEQRWSIQFNDKNFMGLATQLGLGIGQTEDSRYWSAGFRQRRILGSRWRLGLDYADRDDGYNHNVFLGRPFYAQADPWSLELRVWESQAEGRYYLSNAGPVGLDPSAPASLYTWLPLAKRGLHLEFLRRVSGAQEGRIWRLGLGVNLVEQSYHLYEPAYEISDGRWLNLGGWLAEDPDLARQRGVIFSTYLRVQSLCRSWSKTRFLLQYGPVEDVPLTWVFGATAGPVFGLSGPASGFGTRLGLGGSVTRWFTLAGGYALGRVNANGQIGDPAARNHTVGLVAGWVGNRGSADCPWQTRIFAEALQGGGLSGTSAFRLGLDRGLRTLDYDGRAGDRLVRWNVEQGKALPGEVLGFFRVGVAAFYAAGNAWWQDEERDLSGVRHEVGCGLRIGPTRSASSQTGRLDVTWALDGSNGPVFTATSRGFF